MLCYLDLYGTMSWLWYSIWYLGPQHREAKRVRGGSVNNCGAKLYTQYARRVFGMRFQCLSSVMNGGAVPVIKCECWRQGAGVVSVTAALVQPLLTQTCCRVSIGDYL